jgi:hypothetical protein
MKYRICVVLSLLLFAATSFAQHKGRGGVVRKQKVEEPTEDPRITQMLNSVQQVVFIDSMVVDADNYMSYIPLSAYSGKLSQQAGAGGCFTNEIGDRRLVTLCNENDTTIANSDFIANTWTQPQPISGIGDDAAANPFLMPDGITLYYAQKGEKSIGGYDIFVSRYNSERGTFLKPENVGMPFASEANDLFYAIDEFHQLGFFVTDRRQPQGKVCIYTFIPSETRRTYDTDAYSHERLRSLAAIDRIADTWTDNSRQEALTRLENARSKRGNDLPAHIVGQSSELDHLQRQAETLSQSLAKARDFYATASAAERLQLRDEILQNEQRLEQLQAEIRNKEKQIPYNSNN